jgi:hypothetical protein
VKLSAFRALARRGAAILKPKAPVPWTGRQPHPASLNNVRFRPGVVPPGGSTLAWGLEQAPRAKRVGELYLSPENSPESSRRLVVVEEVGPVWDPTGSRITNPDVLVGRYDLGRGWISFTVKAANLIEARMVPCEMCQGTGRCEVPIVSWNGVTTGTDTDALCGSCMGLGTHLRRTA